VGRYESRDFFALVHEPDGPDLCPGRRRRENPAVDHVSDAKFGLSGKQNIILSGEPHKFVLEQPRVCWVEPKPSEKRRLGSSSRVTVVEQVTQDLRPRNKRQTGVWEFHAASEER
jgi:hypothetical protein